MDPGVGEGVLGLGEMNAMVGRGRRPGELLAITGEVLVEGARIHGSVEPIIPGGDVVDWG